MIRRAELAPRPLRPMLVGIGLGLAVAACSATEPEVTTIAIPTAPPSNVCLDALISGRVVTSERWGIALQDAAGQAFKILWPNGYHGVQDGTRVALVDGADRIVAEVGDTIESAGGLVGPNGDPDNTTVVCGEIKVVRR